MPLIIAPTNVPLKVVRVVGEPHLVRHLASLGITKEAALLLLERSGQSALCEVRGTRLALSREAASMIHVAA